MESSPLQSKHRHRRRPISRREKLNRRVWGCVLAAGLIVVAACGWHAYYRIPLNRGSAIRATLRSARLAPLPSSALHLNVRKQGSLFSRDYVLTFQAVPAEIDKWLDRSPGTAIAQPITSDDRRRYVIQPSGDTTYADVVVSNDGQQVHVRAYRSQSAPTTDHTATPTAPPTAPEVLTSR